MTSVANNRKMKKPLLGFPNAGVRAILSINCVFTNNRTLGIWEEQRDEFSGR